MARPDVARTYKALVKTSLESIFPLRRYIELSLEINQSSVNREFSAVLRL